MTRMLSWGRSWPVVLLAACGGADPASPSLAVCHGSTQPLALVVGQDAAVDPEVTAGCVIFPANTSSTDSAQYLLVPQAATTSANSHSSFKLAGGAPITGAPPIAAALQATPPSPAQQFHDQLRLMEQERSFPMPSGAAQFAAPSGPAAAGSDTLNNVRTFKVLANLTNTQITQNVTATVKSVGTHFVIYVDNAAPAGGFSTVQLDSLRNVFDTLLYAVDTTAFGRESDIDGNGKVIVLLSGVLNSLVTASQCLSSGYVAGFFFGADIDPAFHTAWNNGEIFYSIVPDPSGSLSCAHSTSSVKSLLPVTFIHEFQHMISYNQHVLIGKGSSEELWLNEGLSHYAEERGGWAFLAAGDSTHFCDHVRGVLYDFGLYVANPGATGLVMLTGLGTLDERGAWWSFVRFIVDQYAADTSLAAADAFTRRLDQTALRGTSNIVNVTGQPFDLLSRRWVLANYVSDLPGFAAPATMKYKRWAFRSAYPQLKASCATIPAAFQGTYPLVAPGVPGPALNVVGTMYAGSAGTYQRVLQGPSGASFTLLFGDGTGALLDPSVVPKLQVIRIR